jgi:hypothetical protein
MKLRVHIVLIALIVSALLLFSCSLAPAHAAYLWNVQTVDEYATIGSGCPIAVDSNNTAHIAYFASVNGTFSIIYASWTSSGWINQTVAPGRGPNSLVLDAYGNPHILYSNSWDNDNNLMIASWNERTWGIENTGIKDASYAMLELDSSGNPHIVYINNNAIKYGSWTQTNWNIQTVANVPENSGVSSLTFDPNGTPYILYHTPSIYQE